MDDGGLHLVKLCVGADGVEDLESWQAQRMRMAEAEGRPAAPRHVTRMWPRRAPEILRGGSLYWVFKGMVLARQAITALEPAPGDDGVTRCAIVLDPVIVRTEAQPRRPFQGWRYLSARDAPRDLGTGLSEDAGLPPVLEAALAHIGVVRRRR